MYKAIKVIGEYGIGDTVPDRQAEAWLEVYAVPHVEKVEDAVKSTEQEVVEKQKDTVNDILEDYLERNQSVVKKNVAEDKLNKNQIEQLLKIEKNDKSRPLVLNAIKQRLRYL